MAQSDIQSFLTYLGEVKPFHTKLSDSSVIVQYSLSEPLNVKMFDYIDSISAKLSSVWSQSWRQSYKAFPVLHKWDIWAFDLSTVDLTTYTDIIVPGTFTVYVDGTLVTGWTLEFSDIDTHPKLVIQLPSKVDVTSAVIVMLNPTWELNGSPINDATASTTLADLSYDNQPLVSLAWRISFPPGEFDFAKFNSGAGTFVVYKDDVEVPHDKFTASFDNDILTILFNEPVPHYSVVESDLFLTTNVEVPGTKNSRAAVPVRQYRSWQFVFAKLSGVTTPTIDAVMPVHGWTLPTPGYSYVKLDSQLSLIVHFDMPIPETSVVTTDYGTGLASPTVYAMPIETTSEFVLHLPEQVAGNEHIINGTNEIDLSVVQFYHNRIADVLPAYTVANNGTAYNYITFTYDTPQPITDTVELISNTETNTLFTNKKNVFSFLADGSATYREFNIPLTLFPRSNKITLSKNIVAKCQPIISPGETTTDTFRIPFTDSNYFTITVDGVVQPLSSMLALAPPAGSKSGTVKFDQAYPVDADVRFIVNYFNNVGDNTFRVPFNCGFELYKNGVLFTDYTRLDNNTIHINGPALTEDPAATFEVVLWTVDTFKIEINGQPAVYKIYAYDSSTAITPQPKAVPGTIVFARPYNSSVDFSADPIRTLWAKDVLRDPSVWINSGNTGVEQIPLGLDPAEFGFDFTEFDGEYFNTNTVLEVTTAVDAFGQTEYFCKLLLADVPKPGTRINFTFHQGYPWLNVASTSITDGGFISVKEDIYSFAGYDNVGFDSTNSPQAPGSSAPPLPYEGLFDQEIFFDNSTAFKHPLEQWQPFDANSAGFDNSVFDNVPLNEGFDDVTVSIIGHVATITINAGGTGYSLTDTSTFTGSGNAIAQITEVGSAGEILAVKIVHQGYGYTSPPILSFSGGSGANFTCTISDKYWV